MLTLHEKEWKEIKKHIPTELSTTITNRIIASTTIGKTETITVKCYKDGIPNTPVKVTGENLNDIWAITPKMYDSDAHRTQKTLTHKPTGLYITSFKNRTKAMLFWNKIKALDIHYDNLNDIMDHDGDILHKMARENKES